jgi:serine protease DegQ
VRVEDQAVATLAAQVAPSIVTVAASTPGGARRGSGVCVRHAGDILTSARLVRGASEVLVTTHDGMTHVAKVIGHDAATDLALLRIDTSVQAASISDEAVQAGDSVLAVAGADDSDKEPWIGDGIVSSIDSSVAEAGGPTMDGLIATNASPGRMGLGGALLDRQGQVAGILLAPVSNDASTYAVPIALAARIANELDEHGVAVHGWLGVNGTDVYGEPVVTAMTANGPAAKGGMRVGDVLRAIDGTPVITMADVTAAVRWYQPNTKVVVKVERGKVLFNMAVVLGNTAAHQQSTTEVAASAGGA